MRETGIIVNTGITNDPMKGLSTGHFDEILSMLETKRKQVYYTKLLW